jgi:ubiquinone/menaquinone biosynthesis C-methylase UbiE
MAQRAQPNIQLFGVDADARMLRRAKDKLSLLNGSGDSEDVVLTVASATRLPFPTDTFDVAVTSLVFHHLKPDEKRLALEELHRVLVPGGKLLLADFGHPSHIAAWLKFLPVRLLDGWRQTACNVRGRLPRLIRESGLSNATETLTLQTLLGTMRCYAALKPWRQSHDQSQAAVAVGSEST